MLVSIIERNSTLLRTFIVVVVTVGIVNVVDADTDIQEHALDILEAGTFVEYDGKTTGSLRKSLGTSGAGVGSGSLFLMGYRAP
jgi:hypothetical protein